MLVIRFSVAVAKEHAEEVATALHNEFGVEILRKSLYEECFLESILPSERVYIDCVAPYDRIKFITTWLNIYEKSSTLLTY